jgi:hypothetical protein
MSAFSEGGMSAFSFRPPYLEEAPTFVEVIHSPDSTEEQVGREPPPLCPECPDRNSGEPKWIRVVEVHCHRSAEAS